MPWGGVSAREEEEDQNKVRVLGGMGECKGVGDRCVTVEGVPWEDVREAH